MLKNRPKQSLPICMYMTSWEKECVVPSITDKTAAGNTDQSTSTGWELRERHLREVTGITKDIQELFNKHNQKPNQRESETVFKHSLIHCEN